MVSKQVLKAGGLTAAALAVVTFAHLPPDTATAQSASQDDQGCYTAPNGIALCPRVPIQTVDSGASNLSTLDKIQHEFDVYSWQAFVGLNWPLGEGTAPDPSTVIGATGDATGTWQSYKNVDSVFLPGGETPLPWEMPNVVPEACKALAQPGLPIISQIAKTPLLVSPTLQPFKSGPLIDRAGVYTRFQISMNEVLYNGIVEKGLYSLQGQKDYAAGNDSIQFACSTATGSGPYDGTEGAMTLKSSWKILNADDTPARFHTTEALVYTPASTEDGHPVAESCERQTIGLVGFHIAQKLANTPQWIWSTFEQVDNVPDVDDVAAGQDSGHYNYYQKDCTDCTAVNDLPPHPWDPNTPNTPNQVVRQIPITEATRTLNDQWQEALRSVNPASVWQYYELVSTQWPTEPGTACGTPGNVTRPFGTPAPTFLGNTTLETYIQGTVPRVSSSCIDCHGDATDTQGTHADFTYTLTLAQ